MIKKILPYFNFQDKRGGIHGVINTENWEEINLITSEKGSVRGGHFHKNTKELFLIITGRVKVITQKIDGRDKCGEEIITFFEKNDIFIIEPNTFHTFEILEDSKWINVLSNRIENKNPDIHRLS